MGNVIRFEGNPSSGPRGQVGSHEQAKARISSLVGTALQAQEIARRGVIVALFELECTLGKCRQAITEIPAGDRPERRRLEENLETIELKLRDARKIAESL